ncbi:MAG: hypothetical protein WD156_09510 [Acidimicrobiia bacterium]
MQSARDITAAWPEESREAAELVIDARGEPDEATDSLLIWHQAEPWKRIVASKEYYDHQFPAPHIDSVESVLDYRVPADVFTRLANFDGSVVVERTAGEVSARCHDEQANFLALNLMDDIVQGRRSVEDAREYYATEFLGVRKGEPTPYMEGLRFEPGDGSSGDPDTRVISEDELEAAQRTG